MPSKPKRLYCAGPPPPAITLVPPRDSTAYIVSKLVLPSVLESDATTQRRLYYIVGWTDLPNAKVAILATRILDYVSPREFEDWEYHDFLSREEERRLAELAALATPVKKKKRGRPRKGPSGSQGDPVRTGGMQLTVPDSEAESEAAQGLAGGGPSLSTPSKRKWHEIIRETEAEDTGTDSENVALMKQLYSEGHEAEGFSDEVRYGDEMDIDSEAVDLLRPASAGEDMWSRASSLAAPLRPAMRASPALSSSLRPGSASSSMALPSVPAGQLHFTGKSKATERRETPIPLPRPGFASSSRTSTGASTPLKSAYFPAASTNGAQQPPTAPPRKDSAGFTPVPVRKSCFAPASLPVPRLSTPPAVSSSVGHTPQPTSTPKSGRKKRRKEKNVKEEEEAWAVKRLEGDKYDYDESGTLIRYFKVLWEGDWPSWQNPSWEPEENISEELKAEYLEKQKAKLQNGYLTGKSPAKSVAKPSPFLPKKRYSNVAEAFAGELNDVNLGGRHAEDEEDQDGEETFVVADEPQHKTGEQHAPTFTAFDKQLATYRSLFHRDRL